MSRPASTAGPTSTESHDFAAGTSTSTASAPALTEGRGGHHVHYALNLNTSNLAPPPLPANEPITRSDTDLARPGGAGLNALPPLSPILRRRNTRAPTFRVVQDFEEFEVRPGWTPGAEPGVDPSKPDGGHASMPTLSAPSSITVVDFSQTEMETRRLDNSNIAAFLKEPPPEWMKCRWINVNGLSWDVIQALGQHKKLHTLAIEDLMNTRNRTKADWYSTHTFIVLTLQKLVHLDDATSSDDDDDDDGHDGNDAVSWKSRGSTRSKRGISRTLRRWFRRSGRSRPTTPRQGGENGNSVLESKYLRSQPTGFSDLPDLNNLRTLQRYHASPNDARTEYMEKHSVLAPRRLAVVAEQTSMFLTNDNTIISFFELSAEDVEKPIFTRLSSPDTLLRRSCDASMIVQAIIDAIIDLAIPVTAVYADVVADLELDVLTRPNISHTKKLYIATAEINKMLSFISPIMSLISALRDHKSELSQEAAIKDLQNPDKGVTVTPMTNTYLGDVLDHCVLITDSLNQIKLQADGMISLIFNTISAYQNESMKNLTLITIIFLPLTFITGYFGQNFTHFPELEFGLWFFWSIAPSTVLLTIAVMMRDSIYDYIVTTIQRYHIVHFRKNRRKRDKLRKK